MPSGSSSLIIFVIVAARYGLCSVPLGSVNSSSPLADSSSASSFSIYRNLPVCAAEALPIIIAFINQRRMRRDSVLLL